MRLFIKTGMGVEEVDMDGFVSLIVEGHDGDRLYVHAPKDTDYCTMRISAYNGRIAVLPVSANTVQLQGGH